ncbi:hypothetical protein CDD82_2090 [Ophiocordyceps australis]|uniref:Uncharacterized protein n=1 Tax=Ophiocordyceps australis TaxID=1399860 RepID=A0A2C5YZ05_9HYPO|nr:hypothetical protein CDD82_2090 [Ophiocordyceps australis]
MGLKLFYLVLGLGSLVACFDIGRHSLCLPYELRNSTQLVEREYEDWGGAQLEVTNHTRVSLADALGWTQQEPWMELLVQAAELWNPQRPEIAAGFRNVSAVSMFKWQVGILSRSIHSNERCLRPLDPKMPQDRRNRQSMDFLLRPLSVGWAFSQWDSPHELVADCYQPRRHKQHDLYWPLYEQRSLRMLNWESGGPALDFLTSLRKVMDGDWKCGKYECGRFAKGSAWVPHDSYELRKNLVDTLGTRSSFCFVWNWKRLNMFKELYYIDISTPMTAQEKAALQAAAEEKQQADAQRFTHDFSKKEAEHLARFMQRVEGSKPRQKTDTTAKTGNQTVAR